MGSTDTVYSVKVPQWPHPVYVRGGTSTDTIVLYEILATNEYSIVDALDSPAAIIDGGANIGLAAVYFLNLYPSARVVLVEPFAEAIELCRKNLAPYGARARCVHGAIWPHPGKVDLDPQGDQHWANKVKASSDDAAGSGKTDAWAMPALIEMCGGSVDLLKLDVEGSEREIFDAGARAWLPFVRNIVIELHGEDCKDRFFTALAGYDYEMSHRDMVYYCRNLRQRVNV